MFLKLLLSSFLLVPCFLPERSTFLLYTFFSLLRSLTSLKRFSFSVASLHFEHSSLLLITSLSLHIFSRTLVHIHHDAPASHSFSSLLTFSVLRVLLSSTCSCPSATCFFCVWPTEKKQRRIYMRAYNSCQELGDPVPVLRLLALDVKLKVLTVRNKVLNVRHMYIYNT